MLMNYAINLNHKLCINYCLILSSASFDIIIIKFNVYCLEEIEELCFFVVESKF